MAEALPLPIETALEALEKTQTITTRTEGETRDEERGGRRKVNNQQDYSFYSTRTNEENERKDDYERNPFYLRTKETEMNAEALRRSTEPPLNHTLFYSTSKKQEEEEDRLNSFLSPSGPREEEDRYQSRVDQYQVNSHSQRRTAMEAALTCGVCLREFDSEYSRPVLLPECGHTFCRACVKGLKLTHDHLYCPTCRHEYKNAEVDHFPINFSLQILASGKNKERVKSSDGAECQTHGIRYSFWCRSCEVPVCGECLYEGHQQPTHGICRIQDVVMEIKSRSENLVTDANEEAKIQLAGSLRRVLQGVSDLQEASHILQEASRISRQVPGSMTLPAITAVFESAKAMKRRVEALNCGGGGGGEGAVGGASASSSASSTSSSSPVYPSLSSLRTGVSGRPVVVALGETGGLAQVKVEEMGIHLYSLRPASTAYSVAIKLNVLLACLNKSSPRVFLDIKAGERALGRVYLKLWGEMRRAEQFVALCLGLFGPSYRDTRFDGVSAKGEPGEYVRGGDYTGKQGLGGEALMDNLEWGGEWTKPMQAGQVCGVGGEEKKKFGALYAICLRDNPSGTFRAPFGMVISGMEVIEVACRHDPFNMVRVADCGVVIDVQGSV